MKPPAIAEKEKERERERKREKEREREREKEREGEKKRREEKRRLSGWLGGAVGPTRKFGVFFLGILIGRGREKGKF
jgi:hypothetical protein